MSAPETSYHVPVITVRWLIVLHIMLALFILGVHWKLTATP